jgi:sulfite exporter TauE/SafE
VLISAGGYFIGKRARPFSFLNGFYIAISQLVSRMINRAGRPGGALLFGMTNGLLPCGMVYIAAVTSISYGSILHAGLFMLFFGMGTLPAMMIMAVAGRRFIGSRYNWLRKLSPLVITTVGVLLLLRGLNLNIPYISPAFDRLGHEAVSCHF